MEFKAGDIVRTIVSGKVDWEVIGCSPEPGFCILRSGMTGRRIKVAESHLKIWTEEYAKR